MSGLVTAIKTNWEKYEIPTWLLLGFTYSLWAMLVYWHAEFPVWVLLPLGAFSICMHGSLQHEAIHGHPTKIVWLNSLLVSPPLGLWMPYPLYKKFHLYHHSVEQLTDPVEDTESSYVTPSQWEKYGPLGRALLRVNQTLLGRLLIGPLYSCTLFFVYEVIRMSKRDFSHVGTLIGYFAFLAIMIFWIVSISNMNLLKYMLLFALPGHALTLMRSYHEHGPGADNSESTAIIEGSPLTQLLYLNNNFHLVHHLKPNMPWFKIKSEYYNNREKYLGMNKHFLFKGYDELFKKFGFTPKDHPIHPDFREA